MDYYHMTALSNLSSISAHGLIPQNGENGRLIGENKTKVFFSEGFEGAIALFVDFDIVFNKIKTGQTKLTDRDLEQRVLKSKDLLDYLGEGVYLRFDGARIENERNFENGCTDSVILPECLSVCVLQSEDNGAESFSRWDIIRYMMSKTLPEQIQYYGVSYTDSPNFADATARIQEKVKRYYQNHQTEIGSYHGRNDRLCFVPLKSFLAKRKDTLCQSVFSKNQEKRF